MYGLTLGRSELGQELVVESREVVGVKRGSTGECSYGSGIILPGVMECCCWS